MKHHAAIKVLTTHIEKLNNALKEEEKIIEEPELMASYHIARANAGNIELEINAMHGAIEELRKAD